MANINYKVIQGVNSLSIGDLDVDKEIAVSIKSGYEYSNTIYLKKKQIVSLQKHLDCILKQN